MADYSIRLADSKDAEQIMNLRKRLDKIAGNKNPPLNPYGGDLYPTLQQQLSEIEEISIKGIFIVAVHQQQVLGIGYCFPMWNSTGEFSLKFLVDKDRWGKGIATDLVAELVRWGTSTGSVHKLTCRISRFDKTAKRILEKSGFSVVKQGCVPYIQGHYYLETEMSLNIRS